MITEVHAITGFAHIKVKQTDINKWCYIRKHAFRQSCLMMFLVKRAIPLSNEGRAEALGFFAARSRRQRGVISVTAAIRPNRCVRHSGWKLHRHTTSGRHVRLLPWSEYLCLRFKSTSEKTDPSGCPPPHHPPFKAPLLWSILSLKLQQQKKKNVLILFFFPNHIIWCQNNLLSCV